MKKVILGLIFALLLASCNEEQLLNNHKYGNDFLNTMFPTNPYNLVGKQHNEIVDYYKCVYQKNVSDRFFYHDGVSYITRATYDNMINAISDYMVNILEYNYNDVQSEYSRINQFYSDFGLFVTIDGNDYVKILKDYHGAINYMYQRGYCDSATYSVAMKIYTQNEQGFTCDVLEVIDGIERDLVASNWSNQNLASFISIFRNSEEFWAYPITTYKDSSQIICGLSPGAAIALADGLGGLVGTVGWMVGSPLFWGTLASMAEAEDQANNNSILCGHEYPESRYYKKKK